MCGLIVALAKSGDEFADKPLRAALARMLRRGPDGEGAWRGDGVVIGHRRLAIIDLDQRAAQPMHSVCGRYVIAFNGEIYNYRDLRRELEQAAPSSARRPIRRCSSRCSPRRARRCCRAFTACSRS